MSGPDHAHRANYVDDRHLAARQSIYDHATGGLDLHTWVLSTVRWAGDERVLDAGCGNGVYLARLAGFPNPPARLVGLDTSLGMLRTVRAAGVPAGLVAGDAARLPFADGAFDVALAGHMLYHVSDPAAGARELARVLRPAGALIAVTNGAGHVAELHELFVAAAAAAGDGVRPPDPLVDNVARFSMENGIDVLTGAFATIRTARLPGRLEVPDPEPVLAYLDSTRTTREPVLTAGVTWEDVRREAAVLVRSRLEAEGTFAVTTDVGLFLCRRAA